MRVAGAVALASLAALTSAQEVVITTQNECWKGEGGRYIDGCSDVYFLTCDNYEVAKGDACNVFVFSDSRINWIPTEISVNYWAYYRQPDLADDMVVNGADFGEKKDSGTNCYPAIDTPTVYSKGAVMNYTGGMCGYKY